MNILHDEYKECKKDKIVFIPLLKGIHETQQESILVAEFAIPFHPYMFHIDWVSFGSFFVARNCCWNDDFY